MSEQKSPRTIQECKEIGRRILEAACDSAAKICGERPHVEDRGDRLVVVWPDGAETNELTIQDISDQHGLMDDDGGWKVLANGCTAERTALVLYGGGDR